MIDVELDDLEMPVFVYGTLRPKKGNASLWQECGATDAFDGEALVHGWRIRGNGIPYAERTYDDEDVVVGCLIYPPDEVDLQIRMRWTLDALEGHPAAYHRRRTEAWLPLARSKVDVWIYDGTSIARGPVIPGGDYYNYQYARG